MTVFVTRGMAIGVPPGGLVLSVGTDGTPTSSVTLHVRFDVCPTWVNLALQHLDDAKARRTIRERSWLEGNNDDKAAGLEREFEASMQAIMAAAVAIDAFYSVLQPYVALPPELLTRWRAGRTARHSQVAEVLRRAFRLKPKGGAALRRNLKEIYRLRDLAVHPSGRLEAPIMHPEINVGVEWRFAYFRAYNAEVVVNAATWILWDLAHNGKPKDIKIQEYMSLLRQRLTELFPTGHPNSAGLSSV